MLGVRFLKLDGLIKASLGSGCLFKSEHFCRKRPPPACVSADSSDRLADGTDTCPHSYRQARSRVAEPFWPGIW